MCLPASPFLKVSPVALAYPPWPQLPSDRPPHDSKLLEVTPAPGLPSLASSPAWDLPAWGHRSFLLLLVLELHPHPLSSFVTWKISLLPESLSVVNLPEGLFSR